MDKAREPAPVPQSDLLRLPRPQFPSLNDLPMCRVALGKIFNLMRLKLPARRPLSYNNSMARVIVRVGTSAVVARRGAV